MVPAGWAMVRLYCIVIRSGPLCRFSGRLLSFCDLVEEEETVRGREKRVGMEWTETLKRDKDRFEAWRRVATKSDNGWLVSMSCPAFDRERAATITPCIYSSISGCLPIPYPSGHQTRKVKHLT